MLKIIQCGTKDLKKNIKCQNIAKGSWNINESHCKSKNIFIRKLKFDEGEDITGKEIANTINSSGILIT